MKNEWNARVIRAVSPHSAGSRRIGALLLLALALAFAIPGIAAAQPGDDGVLGQQRRTLDTIAAKTEELDDKIDEQAGDDGCLVEIRLELERLSTEVLESGLAFRPRLSEINTRLDEMGEPPEDGESDESAEVREERERLQEEKAEINALIGEAERLSLRINRMVDEIGQMRRDLFASTLSKRFDINFSLAGEVASAFTAETRQLYSTVSSWVRYLVLVRPNATLVATFLALLAALALAIGGRRMFGDIIKADPEEEAPSYLSRLSVAFWSTLLPSAALAAFLGATYLLYQSFGLLREDIRAMMWTLFNVIGVVYFIYRLSLAVLSPRLPEWRIVPVESRAARMLVWLVFLTAAITGADYVLGTVNDVLGAPLPLTVGKSLTATVLVGVLLVLIARVRPYAPGEPDAPPRPWSAWFRALLYVFGAVTIAAALLGYIGLARFLSQQVVVTGAILVTMYIGFLSANALSGEDALGHTAFGRILVRRLALDETTLDQFGLVLSMAVYVLVLLLGVPLILFQWGFQWADIAVWFLSVAREVSIGQFSFSIVGILTGVLVFIIGYFVTRWLQGWLDNSVMARGRVDLGVRNSIRTAVGYVGVAIAGLIGIAAAGIDLSNLALVAGALSLGIGFGMQNVVSNFVSGLILLAERPFKAGDWIVAGGVQGTVKKISVRATEVETFQRQTVILPNSDLINAAVGNWTHKNSLGRVDVAVGVAYGSDVRKVHDILFDIAQNHPLVLKNPEPFVLFTEFGESSFNFEVRVYLADILDQLAVMNDIRFAVIEAFAKEGIQIPFPQRDIHLKSGADQSVKPQASGASKPRRPRRRPAPDE